MADKQVVSDAPLAGDPSRDEASYEPPRLTPLGNLNDLLAGGGSQCDNAAQAGHGIPAGNC
jgi:hypothetical protein